MLTFSQQHSIWPALTPGPLQDCEFGDLSLLRSGLLMRDGESSMNSAPKPLAKSFRAELHPQDTRESMANFWNYHSGGTTRP